MVPWRRRLARDLLPPFVVVAALLLLRQTVGAFQVDGASMEPTLRAHQYVIVDRVLPQYRPPQRGEVIVFRYPRNPNLDYVKRVIGLPGERIAVAHGRVWVNGWPLSEPYVRDVPRYFWGPATVPPDSVFVLGDNRNSSSDSHLWGTVPLSNVVGRAWLAVRPAGDWTWLAGPAPSVDATY